MGSDQRYILAKKIARGGMAEIWLGKQVGEDGFQRLCAVKRILPHYAQEKEFVEMFRDEAHIGKRLQHANIVSVMDFDEVDGAWAIIMEFVDGSDLRSVLSTCEKVAARVSIPAAVFIAAEVARGLHYAHTKQDEITQKPLEIVHRDISPQNILISYEGEVKITDFGIADADNKMTETKPGVVKGKYAYMSPEQISGKQVDGRTDVFALAVVLWEMLCMRRLFAGDNEVETIQAVKNCKVPQTPREANAEVDEELDQIVMRALARDQRKRYNSAEEFEKDLRRYLGQRFPGFTASDLGSFMKRILADKKTESAAEIKKTLTSTNLKQATKTGHRRLPTGDSDSPRAQGKAAGGNGEIAGDINPAQGGDQAAPAMAVVRPGAKHPTGLSAPVSMTGGSITSSNIRGPGRGMAAGTPPRSSTSQNRPTTPTSRNRALGGSYRHTPMGLIAAIAAVVIVIGAWLLDLTPAFLARDPAALLINAAPQIVKIAVDGKPIFDGKYTRAPVKFQLPPGRHQIAVFRAGYELQKFEVELQSGKTQSKSLRLRPAVSFAPTRIDVTNMANRSGVYIDINDGFDGGIISAKKNSKPLLRDLGANQEHKLEVFDAERKNLIFTCKFNPKGVSDKNPTLILVEVAQKRCTERNPI